MSPEVAEDLKFGEDFSQWRWIFAEFSFRISIRKQFPLQRIFDLITVFGIAGEKSSPDIRFFIRDWVFSTSKITFRQVMLGISRKHTFRQCLILNVLWFSFKQENSQAPATKIFVYFSNLIFSVVFPFFSPARALWSAGHATVWLNIISSHETLEKWIKKWEFSQDTGARHRCLFSLRFMLQIALAIGSLKFGDLVNDSLRNY